MKKSVLVILMIWLWCWWVYKNQNWVLTPHEAQTMYETGATNLRLMNFGLIALAMSLFYLKTESIIAVLFLAISPWWMRFGVFDRAIAWQIFLSVAVFYWIKNKRWLFGLLLLIFIWPIYNNNSWFWKDENLNIKNAQVQTLIRYEQETAVNNGLDIISPTLRRIAYNKYFYIVRRSFIKLAEVMDWENISSPSQKNVTVGNNPFSMKGLAMVPPLMLILGISGLAQTNWILLVVGLIAGFLGKSGDTLQNTLLFAPVMAIGVAKLVNKMPKRLSILMIIMVLVMAKDLWSWFIFQEARWNENKNRTAIILADLAAKTPGRIVVSEMLAPTHWYYWYKYGKDERITFKHFGLKEEKKIDGTTYIGLPGEFVGSKGWEGKNEFKENEAQQGVKVIESIPLVDTVSYGNGDFIWVGK